MQLLSNCYQRNICEAGKPWFYWVFRLSCLTPLESSPLYHKCSAKSMRGKKSGGSKTQYLCGFPSLQKVPKAYVITPTRSLKAWLKQFCMGDMVLSVLIICILHRIWAIRFFVANMLPDVLTILPHETPRVLILPIWSLYYQYHFFAPLQQQRFAPAKPNITSFA